MYKEMMRSKKLSKFMKSLNIKSEKKKVDICNMFEFERLEPFQLVLKQNDRANLKYYYIVKGRVSVNKMGLFKHILRFWSSFLPKIT